MTDTDGYTSDRRTSVTGGNPETFGYDTAGRMTSRGTSTFTWSPLDRMVTATVSGTSAAYGYDGDGYRVRSTVGGAARYFLHDGSGRILAEYDGSGNLLIEHIYLGDRRIASRQADGTRSYVQHDLLGSSWIVTQSSNSGEYAIWDYWPFGEPVSQFDFQAAAPELAPEALCTAANPLFCDGFESGNLLAWTCTNGQGGCIEPDWELFEPLFTGKKQDAVTDLFYFEARFMDAKLGRFVSPDEGPFVLENPQTFNRYAYAVNSPFRYGDPNGESPTLISGAVGFVAGGLVGGLGSIGVQLWNNGGSFSDINWRDVGASSAGGAVSGGLAGLTLGASLAAEATLGTTVLASTAVGAATNPVGGAVQRALDSSPETRPGDLQAVAADAAWGAAGGAVGGRVQAGYNARILQAEAQVIASVPAASRGSWGAAQSIHGHATIAAHASTFGPIASNVASSKVTGIVAPALASSASREETRP